MTSLSVEHLRVTYGAGHSRVVAVDDVSFHVPEGGVLGLVGESGSGKSTIGRAIVGLAPVASGSILLDGQPIMRRRRGRVSMVFQDPYASLNPRMTIGATLREAVSVTRGLAGAERGREVARLLDLVQLTARQGNRYPAQLSGGQRQRAAIARALASDPQVLIADEITSALDVSVQASVLNVMREIIERTRVTTLFISHNLAVVRYVSDSVAVLHCGQLVEHADKLALFGQPQHPYTEVLLASIPTLTPTRSSTRLRVEGEPPDPHNPPSGCRFRTRCPVGPLVHAGRSLCAEVDPITEATARSHRAACHFATPLEP